MTGDDVKAANEALVESMIQQLRDCVSVGDEMTLDHACLIDDAADWISGEPARQAAAVAAAREEQREACASVVLRDSLPNAREALRDAIRNTPLAATPLADEIAALRRERDVMKSAAERWLRQRDLSFDREEALSARVAELEAERSRSAATAAAAEKAEARVAELEGANRYLTERVDAAGELLEQCEAAEAERDALRAQVEAARKVADIGIQRGLSAGEWLAEQVSRNVLRAIDEAKP